MSWIIRKLKQSLAWLSSQLMSDSVEADEQPMSPDEMNDEMAHGHVEGPHQTKVMKQGLAMRVIFFYPGEEGTYVDHAEVTLYENGIVHIRSNVEETTTHLQNCEILWSFENEAEERSNKVRLLKPKSDHRVVDDESQGEVEPRSFETTPRSTTKAKSEVDSNDLE